MFLVVFLSYSLFVTSDLQICKVAGNSQRKVGLIYDETMCKYDTPDGEDHPECPDRIRVIWEKLELAGVSQRWQRKLQKESKILALPLSGPLDTMSRQMKP